MAIDFASKLVESEGGAQLTARKVAKGIGYTVGTLYHIFENFDDLVAHVNAATLEEMGTLIEAAAKKKRKPESRIHAMANAYVEYASDHPNRWRLVFERPIPTVAHNLAVVRHRRDAMFAMVADNLRELDTGRVPSEVTHTATALWSGVHGICILAVTGNLYLGGAYSMNKLINALVEPVIANFSAQGSH
ncbi:MAG: TetR/AcrR family transcriptional regulator [Pseudomonadota bacterium]